MPSIPKEIIIPTLINSLCGLSLGYHTGIVSGIGRPLVEQVFNIQEHRSAYLGVFTASILLGMVIGSYCASHITKRFGKKITLFLSAGFNIVPLIPMCFLRSFWPSTICRLLLGVGVGLCSYIGPLYVNESVNAQYRGRVGSAYQLLCTFGIFFAYVMNWLFDDGSIYDHLTQNWRWELQFVVGLAIGGLLFVLSFFAVETKLESQEEITVDNYDDDDINIVINTKQGLKSLRYYVIGAIFGSISQFCGINAVIYYANDIVKSFGIKNSLVSSMLFVGLWNMVSVFITLPLTDRIGRRVMMISAYVLITIGNVIMAFQYFLSLTWLGVIGLFVFIFSFEFGPGCLFWVIAPEMFPATLRKTGLAIALIANWSSNIIVSTFFPILSDAIGKSWSFIIFGVISGLGTAFLYFYLPEPQKTKPTEKPQDIHISLLK